MKWHQADHYYLVRRCADTHCAHGTRCGDATCGRYTASRAWQRHRDAWIYDAWSCHTRPATPLHTGAKDACLAACERHAAQNTGAPA